jgi:hypothetical protein
MFVWRIAMMYRSGKMIGMGLLGVWALGCGQLDDSSTATSEAAALSAAPDGRGAPACGPAHDPRKDRDHRFHNRCEHYAQKHPHRDGRAGNAHLTTRALMDVQKMTTVEATTGNFDDIAPPGRIDELRVEIARTGPRTRDNRTIVARSQNASGYATTTIASLVHGQAMTIDATVSGIDRGADRVSVDDQVRYRPDLVASAIQVPSAPAVGIPTSIAATVREAAGDEGATADCVLSIDGTPSDRANGIWVDAAGLVTCHFTATFATAGAHRLAVDVMNVAPGDYDLSNNHAETSINAVAQFAFTGGVVDSSFSNDDIEDVLDASGAIAYHSDNSFEGRNQSASVSGTWPTAITFPLASVTATATSNGATWSLVELSALAAGPADGSGMTCASGSDTAGYDWVGVCTLDAAGGPATQISVSAFAGDVTYHSSGVCQTTTSFYNCSSGYTWNEGSDPQLVDYHAIVGSLAFGLAITDGVGASLSASPTIPVAPYTTSNIVPRTCDLQPNGEQHCTSHSYIETGVIGSAQQ